LAVQVRKTIEIEVQRVHFYAAMVQSNEQFICDIELPSQLKKNKWNNTKVTLVMILECTILYL